MSLITITQAVKMFYMSRDVFYQAVRRGLIPAELGHAKRGPACYLIRMDDARKVANGEFCQKSIRRELVKQWQKEPPTEHIEELARIHGIAPSSVYYALRVAGHTPNPKRRFLARVKWLQKHPDVFHLGILESKQCYEAMTGQSVSEAGWRRTYRRLEEILEKP